MYYIYHIPGVKIGCTQNPKNRIKQQTKGEYEILETHKDKFVAAKRELELQEQYGYQVDTCDYIKSTSNQNPLTPSIAGKASATKQWKENRDKELIKCSMGGKANAEKTSKVVQQCDLNWNVLNTFNSTKDAARYIVGRSEAAATIRATILNKGTYKGFRWKYPNP